MTSSQSVPHNLEAERALLGSILLDNSAMYTALDAISEDDLYSQSNRLIFSEMCKIRGAGHTVDLVTLSEEFKKRGDLERVGGASYLAALADGVPVGTSATVSEYCRIVKERSTIRRLLNASRNLSARCQEGVDSVADLIEFAHAQVFDIAERDTMRGVGPRPISEIVAETLPFLERTCGQGIVTGLPTGYPSIDAITAGWQEGEFVVLAARPSMGKSALALDFARKACMAGRNTGIFSLEMSSRSLLLRLACRISRIDSNRVRFGRLGDEEMSWLTRAMGEINQWPLWIDDTPGATIEQLRWRIRALAQRAQTKLVIVDHMQLVRSRGENRTQEVTRVSGGLQCASREIGKICGGTLIGLSQLSRVAVGEEPQLHHLRESGSIEQDADVVMFLWDRQKQPNGQAHEPHERVLKVGKQRNGPTGLAPLMWVPARVGFEEVDWDQRGKNA